ncbi:UDP-glycosyltransferase UGT5-like [Haematobia irritans]|uniref:UDP-glycosyltransferase UGT5-like n=1 Tax=Haematobia irritans TaxID=7368 RepID=UPI003F50CC8C
MDRNRISLASFCLIACLGWLQITSTNGANILGLFTSHSPSHLIVHMSVVKVLAERGHNVTVVVSQKPKVTHKDINVILIPPTEEIQKFLDDEVSAMAQKKNNIFTIFQNLLGSLSILIDMQADILADPRFTALYDNPDTKFDLVIAGVFMNNYVLGVAAKFKAPLILSWMGPPTVMTDDLVGNPPETSYVPGMSLAVKVGEKMTFKQRIANFFMNGVFKIMSIVFDMRNAKVYNKLFPNDDGNFPSMWDMQKNVSLVFCNSHFTEGPVRPNVPAVVEIGGIQVKDKPDPLPKDIANFLNSANDTGAILFSLGSNLKGSSIKSETAQYIFNVLSKLKQKVIWKWEDFENTPGKSANILYQKWMPQDDILAHPNLKLFITHAGKGGVAEAQYHGVPMLALPVFADQHGNADKMTTSGYGQQLELLTLTEETFRSNVLELLNNPKYRENVQRFSRLYRDRPLSARESVAYWVDYVLRHHGARHMQSPLVHMNVIESMNLDVYFFLLIVTYILYRVFSLAFCLVCSKLFNRTCGSKKKPKKSSKVKKQ